MVIHVLDHHSESQKYLQGFATRKVKQRPKAVIPSQMAATCILDQYYYQGCALAEPGGPWRLTFALGRLKISDFLYKSYAGHHRISQFQSTGLPSIFLRAQPWLLGSIVGKNSNKKFKFCTCKNDTSGQRMTSTAWVMFPVKSVPSRRMSIKL